MEWGEFSNNPAIMRQKPPPIVPLYAKSYLEAFQTLSGDRINSDGHIGGIPMVSKKAFLELYPVEDPKTFVEIITAMDQAFVASVHRVREMRKKNNDKGR